MTPLPRGCIYVMMITSCQSCGHKLWSEERNVDGIRFMLYFDVDDRSDTYAEHVTECPSCGLSLLNNAIKPNAVAPQRR
jgi:ribosomal protein L32